MVVDEADRTSVPNVYAIGDAAKVILWSQHLFLPATALLTALFSECVSVWQKTVLIYSGYCAGSLGADSGCYRGRKTAVAKTVCRPERANGLRDSELDT